MGWIPTRQKRVQNLKFLNTAMGTIPFLCEKADQVTGFLFSENSLEGKGKRQACCFRQFYTLENPERIWTLSLTQAHVLFLCPSSSPLHSGLSHAPIGLTSSVLTKCTSSSLTLNILVVPNCQTSHQGNRSGEINSQQGLSL